MRPIIRTHSVKRGSSLVSGIRGRGSSTSMTSATIPGRLDQAAAGVAGAVPDEAICLDNTLHPANARLALARAERSHLHAFGLDWDDDSGQNNGHYAPFQWQVS